MLVDRGVYTISYKIYKNHNEIEEEILNSTLVTLGLTKLF